MHRRRLITFLVGVVGIATLLTTGIYLFKSVLLVYVVFSPTSIKPFSTIITKNTTQETILPTTNTTKVPFRVEPVAIDLNVPWSIVFTDENRLLITERPGKIRVIKDGQLLPTPLHTFTEVSSKSEEGLMGMALDPQYQQNRHVYVCLAYEKNGRLVDKVVRLTDNNDKEMIDKRIIIDDIPAARFHAGCRLRFGPDRKLYISTGDATDKSLPQNLNSLGGKILRINADGTLPADNSYPSSAVFSYGHRNPQGFDWHPLSGELYATEHGPSGNDGPGGGDEINRLIAGGNYGWPLVSHEKTRTGTIKPLLVFTPAIAPASGIFYRGNRFPQFTNVFLVGMLRGNGILAVRFDPQEPDKVLSYEKVTSIEVGRVREVAESPEGIIYFSTSNQDGRGQTRAGDDHIYRLIPN